MQEQCTRKAIDKRPRGQKLTNFVPRFNLHILGVRPMSGQNEGNVLMTRNLQSRTSLAATDCPTPLRAAVYLRVSTGRQAEGEVSIPSQRDLTTRHCLSNGWTVVDEYVEPGASATDDRRPMFQAMLERACDADHPYDVIVVHSFSRFFRDGASASTGMALAIAPGSTGTLPGSFWSASIPAHGMTRS